MKSRHPCPTKTSVKIREFIYKSLYVIDDSDKRLFNINIKIDSYMKTENMYVYHQNFAY